MITIVGSLNMDAIARVHTLPLPGETVLARSLERVPGGKGANQAVAAAKAGSEVVMVGRVGTDAYGDELTASLRQAGVRLDCLAVDNEHPTGIAMVSVDDQGENSIVVVQGANGFLTEREVERAEAVIAASNVVVAQLEIPLESVRKAAEMTRAVGATFMLNPAPALQLDRDLLALVDVLVPNEDELARMTGLGAPIDAAACAHLLRDTGVPVIVVTRGAIGALIVTREEEQEIPAVVSGIVDTTGAGDAFVGNLAHALDKRMPLQGAVRFANAAAAQSVRHHGAQTAMPSELETLNLLQGDMPS